LPILIGPQRFLDNAVGIMGKALMGMSRKPILGQMKDTLSWNIAADNGLTCQLPVTRSEIK